MMILVQFLLVAFASVAELTAVPTVKVPVVKYNGWQSMFSGNYTSPMQIIHNGKSSYYFEYNFKATYLQAFQFCQSIHMNLVSVESAEENDRLYKYIRDANKGDNFWSSGTRLLDGSNWVWMTEGRSVEYTNWHTGQPDTRTDHCLEIFQVKNVGLRWNDRDCNILLNFICERPSEGKNGNKDDTQVAGWSTIFDSEGPYVSPNIPLLHFQDKSYYVNKYFKVTFQEAVSFCQMINMQLVTIKSDEENKALYKYIRDTISGDYFWSSGTSLLDGKTWYWLSTLEPVDYTNWLPNQPDSVSELCIMLNQQRDKGLFWSNDNCLNKQFYICEKSRKVTIDVRNNFIERDDPEIVTTKPKAVNDISTNIPLIEIKGKIYHIGINFKASYFKAAQFCNQHGMTLVSLEDEEDQKVIRQLLLPYSEAPRSFWTSGSKLGAENTWTWANGDLIRKFYWSAGEPNHLANGEKCIEIYSHLQGAWNDRTCSSEQYFICEKTVAYSENFNQQPSINLVVKNDDILRSILKKSSHIDTVTDHIIDKSSVEKQ